MTIVNVCDGYESYHGLSPCSLAKTSSAPLGWWPDAAYSDSLPRSTKPPPAFLARAFLGILSESSPYLKK